MAEAAKTIELGFAEKTESWKLRSKFFPSKLGGKPAWLELRSLPDTRCGCGEPMSFIMQVYAPLDNHINCFHRTLFVFGCPDCIDKKRDQSVLVFRSQLTLLNEFYPDTPAVEVENDSDRPSADDFNDLCCVCGGLSYSKCSLCKQRSYCSKQHQVIDWRKAHKFVCAGQRQQHKTQLTLEPDQAETIEAAAAAAAEAAAAEAAAAAGQREEHDSVLSPHAESPTGDSGVSPLSLTALKIDWTEMDKKNKLKNEVKNEVKKPAKHEPTGDSRRKTKKTQTPAKDHSHPGIFPEYEIETETEELNDEQERREDTQEDLANYLKKLDKQSIIQMKEMAASCSDKDLKEVESMSEALNDKDFKRFKKVIDPYPEQILRYCRGGEPLWVSAESIATNIPTCENCGSPREYEFQIMPQALNLLKSDLMDWGVLVVYTCKQSCDIKGYSREFVHRQDFV